MSGGPAELASRPPVVVVVASAAPGPAPAALPTGGSATAPLLPPSSSSAAPSPGATTGPPASGPPPPLPPLPPPPSVAPPSGQRVFQEAVRQGNTRALQALLQGMNSCEFNVNSFGPEGQTALHQSVIDGNLELVKLLVKFGADIRLANRDGWSALHIAAFGGHQDIVLYLITKAKYSASGGAR